MAIYQAPLRDMRFLLNELTEFDRLQSLPGMDEISSDLVDTILEEAGKICSEVLHPINRSGDEAGCLYENGVVRTPEGFKQAYDLFCEGGWTALHCDPAYGGQGLPKTVNLLVEEMICSANMSFGMYPGLTHGAYSALRTHGSDELKTQYLPKMVTGEWSGTMCLTEPHCGTDLGMLRTKAVPNGDGTYKLTGTKIFISAGEHDLTSNIIHLVLARLPDAPEGTRGISLFLVPKFLPDADNQPGKRNGVACGAIEHKMGIKASATCVMNFDEATGWLVGQPNRGLNAMFTMMNEARLSVGVQGLGAAEASYQNAVAYARDRLQGRSLDGAKYPDKPADPILVHPDVRRMLLTMRAQIEGCRALALMIAVEHDVSQLHPDPAERQAADDLVALMTPIIKAYFSDTGFESTNTGMQVFGGHGYIREWGMEQYVRDARIAQIYEGANGVQALDLVGRKLGAHNGRFLRRFFLPVTTFVEENREDPQLAAFIAPLEKAVGRLQQTTGFIAAKGMARPFEAGAASSDYLKLFGLTALAYVWAKMAKVALPKIPGDDTGFYKAKVNTARFFMERVLPQTSSLTAMIMAGGGSMEAFEDAAF